MKKSIVMLTLGLFTTSIITACGNSTATTPLLVDMSQQAQPAVNIESIPGIYKEVKSASTLAFKELDKNADKIVTPEEYGVGTPDSAKAFYALDSNHDGKIVIDEFMPGFFNRVGLTFRLKSAADSLFKVLDKSKDALLSREELTGALVSSAFITEFDKFDKMKKTLFHKDAKGLLSKSEFENLFANVAVSNLKNTPADPAAPSPANPAP